jgi:hypothetical protein
VKNQNSTFTTEEKIALVEALIANGWKPTVSDNYPKMWWIHEELHPHRTGDPKPMHEGAIPTFFLYSGIDYDEVMTEYYKSPLELSYGGR